MRNIEDFLNKVKAVTGSDYKTADLLGVERQTISGWRARRSFPTNRHILKMCDIAEQDVREAMEAVEFSRENERPLKQAGFASVEFMGLLGAGSLGAMSLMAVSPTPEALTGAAVGSIILGSIHYAK